MAEYEKCYRCKGRGWLIFGEDKCYSCNGEGYKEVTEPEKPGFWESLLGGDIGKCDRCGKSQCTCDSFNDGTDPNWG